MLAVLILGFCVRLISPETLPAGLNQDEASALYDAWAILNYGMDRYGNHRLKETHGTGPVARHAGSNGACSDPSRVFKGKRLPGHMGAERVTVQNLEIVKVDVENNLIAIKGAIPGAKNGVVYITDSVKMA